MLVSTSSISGSILSHQASFLTSKPQTQTLERISEEHHPSSTRRAASVQHREGPFSATFLKKPGACCRHKAGSANSLRSPRPRRSSRRTLRRPAPGTCNEKECHCSLSTPRALQQQCTVPAHRGHQALPAHSTHVSLKLLPSTHSSFSPRLRSPSQESPLSLNCLRNFWAARREAGSQKLLEHRAPSAPRDSLARCGTSRPAPITPHSPIPSPFSARPARPRVSSTAPGSSPSCLAPAAPTGSSRRCGTQPIRKGTPAPGLSSALVWLLQSKEDMK